MKLLLYTDTHWSETSSIVRGCGEKYSTRLENLIESINWAEAVGGKYDCDAIVCLGDFFDKPNLTAQEITALKEVEWLDIPHYFLVGNHDANINDLSYASTFIFNQFNVISEPTSLIIGNAEILLLPYIVNDNRHSLHTYFSGDKQKRIILSHNDIAGVNYGGFISTNGFKVDEILKECDLFINGHLHNSGFVDSTEKILNLGNLTGQNFTEDATKYDHYCAILDTDTLEIIFFINPYAFNFYKLSILTDIDLQKFDNLKDNAVLSISCSSNLVTKIREILTNCSNVVTYRLQTIVDKDVEQVDISSLVQTDHLKQFSDYILSHMNNTSILNEELTNIMLGEQ